MRPLAHVSTFASVHSQNPPSFEFDYDVRRPNPIRTNPLLAGTFNPDLNLGPLFSQLIAYSTIRTRQLRTNIQRFDDWPRIQLTLTWESKRASRETTGEHKTGKPQAHDLEQERTMTRTGQGITRRNLVQGAAIGIAACSAANSIPACAEEATDAKIEARKAVAQLNPQDFDFTGGSGDGMATLFSEIKIGGLTLPNRMVKSAAGSDTAGRGWYKPSNGYYGGQRFKIVDLKDPMSHMFSCENKPNPIYFKGTTKAGGYIKVNP